MFRYQSFLEGFDVEAFMLTKDNRDISLLSLVLMSGMIDFMCTSFCQEVIPCEEVYFILPGDYTNQRHHGVEDHSVLSYN